MMATVPHVISGLGLRKFQTDGFLLTRVYNWSSPATSKSTFQKFSGVSDLLFEVLSFSEPYKAARQM